MRVFTASLAMETNTFSPMLTGREAFMERSYFPPGTYPNYCKRRSNNPSLRRPDCPVAPEQKSVSR